MIPKGVLMGFEPEERIARLEDKVEDLQVWYRSQDLLNQGTQT